MDLNAWMRQDELNNWKKLSDNEGTGCILEVDLEYPKELHDLHDDYPLAPEILKVEKLIPNLHNKSNYIIHHESLKLYEKLGLRITKIHRGIKFVESNWPEPYIMKNTNLRMQGKNNFEKDFFKLMNNSVFGKTMENIRNRFDIHLVTNEKQASKLVSKPNYNHRTVFCHNLAAIQMKKIHLVFNKPVYLGMCILQSLTKTLGTGLVFSSNPYPPMQC